jgi:hypothetical protein
VIDKRLLKKFTIKDCTQCRIELSESLKLTKERLRRLKRKQKENSDWVAYDKYADAPVGIDIRIEEQLVVGKEIEQDIILVDERACEVIEESKRAAIKIRKAGEVQIPMRL